MKRVLCLLVCVYVFAQVHAQQSIVRGGFVEYAYLGGKSYEARLNLYVSCPYSDFSPYIGCKVGNDTISGDSLLFILEKDITGIPLQCPIQSKCSGDSNGVFGVKRLVWTRTFDLDTFTNCQVLFFAKALQRDSAITTGSADEDFYIDSWFNQCVAPRSSSPTMAATNENGLMLLNQDHFFNYGSNALSDFDSISYVLTSGKTSQTSSITYDGPYSFTRPICYLGFCNGWNFPCPNLWPAGFHLDPLSGQMMFRPTGLCYGPLAVEMSLWKNTGNGLQVVSKIYREMAVQTTPSNSNHTPKILPSYSIQACSGKESCFTIQTEDEDVSDSTFLQIDSEISGLTYQITHNQSKWATAQVCWTPDSSHVSNIPYTFTATVKDNFCTLPGNSVRSFSFFVRESPKAQSKITRENCGRVILEAIPEKNYTGMQMQWKVLDSLGNVVALTSRAMDTLIMKPGMYKTEFIIRTSTPCVETYYDSFEIGGYNTLEIVANQLYCFGDTVHAQANNSETHSFEYDWKLTASKQTDTASTQQFTYLADSTHYLIGTVRWGDYCQVSDSLLIEVWKPRRELPYGVPHFCKGDSIILSSIEPVDSFNYVWSTGETLDSITISTEGWITLNTEYFSGCEQTDSIEIVPDFPEIYLITQDSICKGDTVQVTGMVSGEHPMAFLWSDSSTTPVIQSAGGWVALQVTDKNNCQNQDSIYIFQMEVKPPDSNYFSVCRGDGFHLYSEDSSGLMIYYSFGDSGNYILPKNSGMERVQVINREGCEAEFPIEIVVNELPDPSFAYSELSERNNLFIPSHQWNASYFWDFGDGTTSSQMIVNHAYFSNGPFLVKLAVIDRTTGCADSSEQWLSFNVGFEVLTSGSLQVFPNPFEQSFQINSSVFGLCQVYSSLGTLVWEGEIEPEVGYDVMALDWNPGVYFIRFKTDKNTLTRKIIRH